MIISILDSPTPNDHVSTKSSSSFKLIHFTENTIKLESFCYKIN